MLNETLNATALPTIVQSNLPLAFLGTIHTKAAPLASTVNGWLAKLPIPPVATVALISLAISFIFITKTKIFGTGMVIFTLATALFAIFFVLGIGGVL